MKWLQSVSTHLDLLVRGVLALLVLGALLGAVPVLLTFLRVRRWLRYLHRAAHLLRVGGTQRAERLFRRVARWSCGTLNAAALSGVAVCRMRQGGYAEAAAVLEPLMERRLPRFMRTDSVTLPGYLSLCLTMLGDTRRAKHWLDVACARFGGMVTSLVLPEVAILCREGHMGAALKLMEDCWTLMMADGTLGPRLRLFRAFAQRKVDPERDADLVITTLVSLAPFPPEELAFCREHWPVLADFMQLGEDLVARHEQERARRQAEWDRRYAERTSALEDTPTPEDDSSE